MPKDDMFIRNCLYNFLKNSYRSNYVIVMFHLFSKKSRQQQEQFIKHLEESKHAFNNIEREFESLEIKMKELKTLNKN